MAPTSQLEKAEKERENHDSFLTWLEGKIPIPPAAPLEKTDIQHYLSEVSQLWTELLDTHKKILSCSPVDPTPYNSQHYKLLDRATQFKLTLHRSLAALPAEPIIPVISAPKPVEVKLPQLKLPTFCGDVNEWISFRDLFTTTIHTNASLSNAQKFTYLQSSLEGPAAKLIKSFSITDSNYEIAWDLIVNRFQNERELYFSIIRKFINHSNITADSPNALRTLVDCTNQCTRALDSLNIQDKWDSILVFLISQKLDSASKQFWELSMTGTEIPTSKSLLDFIEQRARSLAASGIKTKQSNPGPSQEPQRKPHAFHGNPNPNPRNFKCKICEGNHPHYQCPTLLAMPVSERQKTVKSKKLCSNCLWANHETAQCRSTRTCQKCNLKHHTILHITQEIQENKPQSFHVKNQNPNISNVSQTILATALVRAKTEAGGSLILKAFLDGGSTSTFITESCANRLGLKRKHTNAEVTGLGAAAVGRAKGITTLYFKPYFSPVNSDSFIAEAYILPSVTGKLPVAPCNNSNWTHLQNLQLADPGYAVPSEIDILVGADLFFDLLLSEKKIGPPGSPMALQSKLGWLVAGPTQAPATIIQVNHAKINLEECLTKFWELETLPKSRHLSKEEEECEANFQNTQSRDATGRYVVHIPMKTPQVQLGSSRDIAVRRWTQVERRLEANPIAKSLYQEFMQKYLELGHMVKIQPQIQELPFRVYLPHHFILKDINQTNKFRVVFDASAKTSNGNSFNDAQLVGPTIQDTLLTILMRFRSHPVAFTADIAKMFRQILVTPEQQQLQCILYRENPNEPLQEFKLLTVTYGTASAPFLATRVLQQLAIDESASLPLAAEIVRRDMYVDDCISGGKSEGEVKTQIQQLIQIMKRAGLSLRKFASNSPNALEHVPVELRETQDILSIDEEEIIKTLGLHWNTSTDHFLFKVKILNPETESPLTKRLLLSEISKIFDPMGWLSPVIITTKIIMQDLWKEKTDWDEPPPTHIQSRWYQFKQDLPALEKIRIPRCFQPMAADSLQLHGFCDASEKAYAAVVYVRANLHTGVTVSLISAKTKAAPVKPVSLPRLELCGALLLAELIESVQEALQLPFTSINAWTDSTIVLSWLNSNPSRWKTFVANRVCKIQEILSPSQWNHVSGLENPADCASRGLNPSELVEHPLWWSGPKWLRDEDPIPYSNSNSQVTEDLSLVSEAEEKKILVVAKAVVVDSSLLTNSSSLLKLKRVTAWCLRFAYNCKEKAKLKREPASSPDLHRGPLQVRELNSAIHLWIQIVQESEYSQEIQSLKTGVPLPRNSKILNLNPFLDPNHILRVGGRLRHADLHPDKKYPILLPRHNHLTELIIQYEHEHTYHGGPQLVQAVLSQKYWIIRARDAIRYKIQKCVVCTRHRAMTQTQLMGDLPTARVNPSRPFTTTGVDYAGPFILRAIPTRSKVTFKAYMAIFVCFVTRAIHIEIVSSLSTDAFLAALKRFVARRGLPKDIHSDCGTNFVGAANDMKKFMELIRSPQLNQIVSDHLSSKGISWHFNPPSAPHFGGLWEAGVKSVKFHLNRLIGTTRLTYEELSTVTIQIEGCLNSRPLTPLSSDPMDLTALTPAHFLIGDSLASIPEPDLTTERVNRLTRWQLVQQLHQHFWKRWSQEYLTRLQQRPKWLFKQRDIKPNDMVLVKTDGTSPTHWPLARVITIHPGPDGLIRVVTLRTASGEIKRPITKVCLLPIDQIQADATSSDDLEVI